MVLVSTHLLVQFMLILLPLGIIQALDHQGCVTTTGKITVNNGGGGIIKVETNNVKKHVFAVPAAFEVKSGLIGGRKMMMKLGQVLYTDEASDVSGATNFAAKSNLKVNQKLKINSKLQKSRNSHSENVENFVVFNADYHVARPHPPKNN